MNYKFGLNSVIDLAAVLISGIVIAAFFIKRRTYKVLALCLVFYALFLTLVALDALYDAPIAGAIGVVFAVCTAFVFIFVYDRNIRTWFFNMINAKERQSDDDAHVSDDVLKETANAIIRACQNLSKSRTGALMVIAPTLIPHAIIETGVTLDAVVSAELLESLFIDGAPMHDGATIIRRNTIIAAGCFLPLSQNTGITKSLGTRHRAGIGITEETDMVTIIVSEETGIISFAEKGEIKRYITSERLKDILYEVFKIEIVSKKKERG